jgi:hypothetical protein
MKDHAGIILGTGKGLGRIDEGMDSLNRIKINTYSERNLLNLQISVIVN